MVSKASCSSPDKATNLQREQLVNNAHNFARKQGPCHVVVLVERLPGGETAAVHLGVHDLNLVSLRTLQEHSQRRRTSSAPTDSNSVK